MWLGFKIGLGLTGSTKPETFLYDTNGLNFGMQADIVFDWYFSSLFGLKAEVGYTIFKTAWSNSNIDTDYSTNENKFSFFDIKLAALMRFSNIVFWAGPVFNIRVCAESMFGDYEDAKAINFGITAGGGYVFKHERIEIPLTLEFKMNFLDIAPGIKKAKVWGIFLNIGILYGLK
jgi:hypothetical protein